MYRAASATVKLISGNANPSLAERLSQELAIPLMAREIEGFADGETRVNIGEDVRDSAVIILQPTCPPVNDHLMVLALLSDAVRAAGAARIIGIVPYFGYARQEQRKAIGDARSAQVVCRMLQAVSIDELVIVDLHSPALESALPMPVKLLAAEEVFLRRIGDWNLVDPVIVAADAGGMKRAQRYAHALKTSLAVIAKERPHVDAPAAVQVLGDVSGRVCLIVDDMASTGRTLRTAAEALRREGAEEIHAVFTHAVMATGALDQIAKAGFKRVMTSDSIPLSPVPWLEVVSLGPLLAGTLRQLIEMADASA